MPTATLALAKKYNLTGWVLYYKPGCKWCEALEAGLNKIDPRIWKEMNKIDVAARPSARPANVKTVPTWVNYEGDMWDGRPVFRD